MVLDLPTSFVYVFPLLYGLVVGLVEIFFVHADESGLGWLGHGLHAVPWCVIFAYASLNTPFVVSIIPLAIPLWITAIALPLVLGIVTTFKVKAAAALAKGGTVGEKFVHAAIIGLLIALAPFALKLALMVPGIPAFLLQ